MDFEELEEGEGEVTEIDIHGLGPPPIVDFEDETALSQGWYSYTDKIYILYIATDLLFDGKRLE